MKLSPCVILSIILSAHLTPTIFFKIGNRYAHLSSECQLFYYDYLQKRKLQNKGISNVSKIKQLINSIGGIQIKGFNIQSKSP